MLNDSSGLKNPGESLVAQTVGKLVFNRTKTQIVSYNRYKMAVLKQAVAPATFGTV